MIDRGSRALPTVGTTPTSQDASRRSPARDAGAPFEALLLASALKPLATALGFYGDAVVASAATAVLRGGRDALAVEPRS